MATWSLRAFAFPMMKWSSGIWQRPNSAAKAADIPKVITNNPACPVCRGVVSALCPACNGKWSPEDLAAWCKANGVPAPAPRPREFPVLDIAGCPIPAPLPFPAVMGTPDGLRVALMDLRGDLGDMRATLDGLAACAHAMAINGPAAATMRQAADDLFNLSDLASEAARAICDAFPDQVAQ